jgi:hypothetical protein
MIISNARINALIGRPDMVRAFPNLLMTVHDPRSCCGNSNKRLIDYSGIKRSLAAMPEPRKQLFKEMAGLDRCEVVFQQNNSVVSLAF